MDEQVFDVIVIGGGTAGLSAGVVLARARRLVLVIDAGHPRNAPADGVHSYLGHDGVAPAQLLALGRDELASYGGQVIAATARSAARIDAGFTVTLEDGTTHSARRLLVTTGLIDELPDVAGLRERWGRDVVHCPYCHGWEIRDQAIGVLGGGPLAVHQAQLFRQWSKDIVLFQHTGTAPSDDQAEQLAARGIRVVTGPVAALEVADDRITGVRLADGTVVARTAITVGARMVARSAVLDGLGLAALPHPMGTDVGSSYPSAIGGATDVPGLYLAGNVTDLQAGVIQASAQGVLAAATINADLIGEDTAAAVAGLRR